ncbi:calmodulin-binding protein 25-like [Canna indica]|uniref:Calmodulin-binding protein 25-like n=1 Tax=Canna indica TaxID=4628 RepID=A0AAQ3KWK2_9LILI|nr:calmodulin-binding protein 25-like [Canna indica]
MSENCPDLYAWMYGHISETAFARENDAVTKALQMSLLSGSFSSAPASVPSPDALSTATSSLLLPLAGDPPRRGDPPTGGRIGKKRKCRASKRSPTTYISADPANFRELVQQVTGPRPGDAESGIPIPADPLPATAVQVQETCLLPTLDTSAFLVHRASLGGPRNDGLVGSSVLADIDPFLVLPGFPTLDSSGFI